MMSKSSYDGVVTAGRGVVVARRQIPIPVHPSRMFGCLARLGKPDLQLVFYRRNQELQALRMRTVCKAVDVKLWR